MAPKKDQTQPQPRRSPRLANLPSSSEPPMKKAKTTPKSPKPTPKATEAGPSKKKGKTTPKSPKAMNKPEPETDSEPESEATKKGGKTTATKSPKAKAKSEPEAEAEPVVTKKKKGKASSKSPKKSIIIEHCKQCSSFKTRANQVKKGVEEGVEGVNVVVNPDKPRKGCFEIREENGETFVSLLDMKRPFKAMKELDMDQLVSEIVQKIK
ncbi:hypothetical protein LIER_27163 [Lithospermum erythrorhizon]|uniref:Selenoprotein H n=1 Tax=Lithospermum erythrorhizon TaxID=34254 RepID=A0AAV3RD32_LITER